MLGLMVKMSFVLLLVLARDLSIPEGSLTTAIRWIMLLFQGSYGQKQGDSEGSPRQAIAGPITKDEEEVVETLYALVVMFPNNDKTNKTNLDGELSEAKSSALPEGESFMPAFEDQSNPNMRKPLLVRENQILHWNQLQLFVVNMNYNIIPSTRAKKVVHFSPAFLLFIFPRCLVCRTWCCIVFHINFLTLAQTLIGLSKGLALWPGLSLIGSHGAGTQGTPLQLSAAKIPAWLGNACATRPSSVENVVLTERDSRVPIDRKKSWKRCSAHVFISNLIKVLQIGERKDKLPMQPIQLTSSEGSKQGVLSAANDLNGVRNGLNNVASANSIVGSVAEKNPNEVRNAILSHKRLLQDQQQASTTSGIYRLQKQSFDFLSSSAGDGRVEADNRAGNGLEPLTQFHVPYLQLLAQNHTAMPPSLPPNCYSSTPFPDHLSAAAAQQVQGQLPPYLGSPTCGPTHLGATVAPEQQQQQRQIWATHQYKAGGVHIPNWQNGRKDCPSMIQYAQAILPPSRSSLEVLGPMYAPMLQQQQQLIAITTSSLPPARLKRQHYRLPSGYQGNGGGFHPDSAPPLQLLCNEHL